MNEFINYFLELQLGIIVSITLLIIIFFILKLKNENTLEKRTKIKRYIKVLISTSIIISLPTIFLMTDIIVLKTYGGIILYFTLSILFVMIFLAIIIISLRKPK